MQQIIIQRFGDYEAVVEMKGVAVTRSSNEILSRGQQPSHFMTNIMLAALKRIGVEAELEDVKYRAMFSKTSRGLSCDSILT